MPHGSPNNNRDELRLALLNSLNEVLNETGYSPTLSCLNTSSSACFNAANAGVSLLMQRSNDYSSHYPISNSHLSYPGFYRCENLLHPNNSCARRENESSASLNESQLSRGQVPSSSYYPFCAAAHERQQVHSVQTLLNGCSAAALANPTFSGLSLSSMILSQLERDRTVAPPVQMTTSSSANPYSAEKVNFTLQALGSSIRRRADPYVDCAALNIPDHYKTKLHTAQTRGGVAEPFPEKVFRMLMEIEKEGNGSIVSFLPHGRAFLVHDPERFVSDIMPRYFQQTKWSSFTRQLNLWGFLRVNGGRDSGAFYHELFLKGYPGLCLHMRRVGTSTSGLDRRKFKNKSNDGGDPDFYAMKHLV